MFFAPLYSFCISLVFIPAWSRDNPYQIITFDCTDDIHLHFVCQPCLHQEKFKGYQCSFWVSLVFVLTWSRDPNNLLKSYVHIGNIDLHKYGDFDKVLRK